VISYRVDIYLLEIRKDRPKPYGVRWRIENSYKRRSFKTRALAENFRSALMQAARKGEGFDTASGLPVSMLDTEESVTAYDLALRYAALKWPGAAAKTRRATAQALAIVLPALVRPGTPTHPEPNVLRAALIGHAFNPPQRDKQSDEATEALSWMAKNALPLELLNDVTHRPVLIRAALNACATKLDGTPTAASTMRRRRAVLHNFLGHAVELGHLTVNPVGTVQWKVAKVADEVDRRVVLSPRQFQECLTGISYVGYRLKRGQKLAAFFGLLYYAATRPSEALAVIENDFDLPKKGWGLVTLARSQPEVGTMWTNDGTRTEERGLKWRALKEVRPVPIPPVLVRLIRTHIDEFGTGPGGRLFRTATGGQYTQKAYIGVWAAARAFALPPNLAASPLGHRPYDLRHGGVTLWLNSGVPIPEVARRAGHSPDVLLKIYAGCIDNEADTANGKIAAALGDE
jgi:integrase